ncbi:hypothetical protein CBR_g45910 [Chara braunii]|uniref:CCHC-type domain-containing protein n=1 Tax=Chara braunii TaxID=69332 RepID=A0A388LZR4_CHABU|nr:hypothetical protein CBR_g45910 [Chara braunii]|eukprot:GBG87755.1 hypothetical protein CBR_g45910 [Chara braunii]
MASNGNANMVEVQNCYNCGQPGHISRYCPFPDRRLNQPATSTAIVPATPLLTAPAVTVGAIYSNQYSNGGGQCSWLGKRVFTLEEKVARISIRHDAEEARERAERVDADKKKREKEDEERRQREKQEREEQQSKMHKEMGEKLDKVVEAINRKKTNEGNEVAILKAEVERLSRLNAGASTSATVAQLSNEHKELVRLRREQAEMKAAADKCFSSLEGVILALQRQCEDAENNAELLKQGFSLVLPRQFLVRHGKWMQLKGVVERHQAEVELLKEMRLKEVNARRESEKETEKLKEEMARLQTVKKSKARGTNLKSRLDDAACVSARKGKGKVLDSPAKEAVDREAFVRNERKQLRALNKEAVVAICEQEGITYTTLDPTKEDIAQKRAPVVFDGEGEDRVFLWLK